MADFLNTIIPWALLIVGIIWAWSVFGEPIGRFYQWIKSLTSSGKDRFQRKVESAKEFTYS